MKADDSRQVTTREGESGQNPEETLHGAETDVTTRLRTKAEKKQEGGLMDVVCERSNLMLAYDRVLKNQGAAGVDGIGIAEFKEHLKQRWPTIKAKRLAGEVIPSPVRWVDIPKPQGGVRTLGIPTLTDRLRKPSVASSALTDLRGGILRVKLRLSTGEARPSSDQGGTAICCRRSPGWGGYGLGEIL